MNPAIGLMLGSMALSQILKVIGNARNKQVNASPQPSVPQPTVPQPTATPTQPTPTTAYLQGFARKGSGSQYYDLINKAAQQYGIHPSLLAALLFQESGIDTKAPDNVADIYNDKNVLLAKAARDRGVAQINSYWHPEVNDIQAHDPNFAIPWAAKRLASDIAHFKDVNRGVAAYNVGRGGANIRGPQPFGGGPRGQKYLDELSLNLEPELRKQLGLITSYQ